MCERQQRKIHGAMKQRNRIQKTGLKRCGLSENRADHRTGQTENQYCVFDRLRRMIAVQLNFFGKFSFAMSDKADKLMNRAERTEPAAEKSSQRNCQNHGQQSPKQSAIQASRGQNCGNTGKRIEIQK